MAIAVPSFNASRRAFIATTSGTSAAIVASTIAAPAQAMLSSSPTTQAQYTDLLFALGQRAGLEVSQALGGSEQALRFTFLDDAGASLNALREGFTQGLSLDAGCSVGCAETQQAYSHVLGVALVMNQVTGQTARVEIFPSALSQIEMIRGVTASASLQKQAIMSASSDALYSVQYFAS
jgi:hypothetical protein